MIYPGRLRLFAAIVCTLCLVGAVRAGSTGRAGQLDVWTQYEQDIVTASLAREQLTLDPEPAGKIIERIAIDARDVILPNELPLANRIPWTFFNHFHMRTRDRIIAQELLFSIGERYQTDVVEESGRNLRSFFILSIARIVAARGSRPDRVVVLVVTKDQWSLRLNSDFTFDQARLDSLSLSIAENNLAGRNKTAAVDFALDPGRYTVGAVYTDSRLFGSRHFARMIADFYLNRTSSQHEGEYIMVDTGRPLFSLRTKWAWEGQAFYLKDIYRLFDGGDIAQIKYGSDLIPFAYQEQLVRGTLAVTRSFGLLNKINLSLGMRVDSDRYRLPDQFPSTISSAGRAAFTAHLPRSEDASGPYISLAAYRAEYVRLYNLETFALSEDYRVGPSLTVTARVADPLFGFGSRFLELSASYTDTRWFHDDLLTFGASLATRLQSDVYLGSLLVNEDVRANFHNTSPRFGPFRFHLAGSLRLRNHDLNHVVITLGSDNGLRGFASRSLYGNDYYLVNAELRTVALNFWTLHVGLVAFYDGGDAPASWLTFGWRHDAGVGARLLIPQFNRGVLRLDFGFPLPVAGAFNLGIPSTGYAPRFSAEFGQAF